MEKVVALLVLVLIIVVCTVAVPMVKKSPNENEETSFANGEETEWKEEKENGKVKNEIMIQVNNQLLNVELENNEAAKALYQKLEEGDIMISASEYGGFEKVGMLGFSLPQNDKQITAKAGDVVLYQGNQISIFYAFNSWNYTKLGKVTNLTSTQLAEVLGDGDVMLTLSCK